MNLRCLDHILQRGCDKTGIPYLPDRLAQLTVPARRSSACHYCGNCTEGCDTGSFFSTPYFLLPAAEKTGKLELRDERGGPRPPRWRTTDGRMAWPTSIATRSRRSRSTRGDRGGGLLRGVRAHPAELEVTATGRTGSRIPAARPGATSAITSTARRATGTCRSSSASRRSPTTCPRARSSGCRAGRTSADTQEKFIRGYSIYPTGGCGEFPWFQEQIEGFGSSLKREIKRHYPTPVSFYCQIPSLPSRDELRGHRSRGEGRLRHPRRARAFPVGAERAAHVGAREAHDGGRDQGIGRRDLGRGQRALHAGMEPARDRHVAHGQRPEAVRDQPLRPDRTTCKNLVVAGRQRLPGCSDKTTTLSILASRCARASTPWTR